MKILKFLKPTLRNTQFSFQKPHTKLFSQLNTNKNTKLSFQKFPIFRFSFENRPPRQNPQDGQNEIPNRNQHSSQKPNEEIGRQQEEVDTDSEDQTSFKASRTKLMFTIAVSSLVMFGIYQALNYLKPEKTDAKKKKVGEVTYIGKPDIGGPWKLMNTDGKFISHKDLEGKYYLIYFGFTQCPDVCPMSLQKISRMLKKIRASQEYKYFDLECFFVSVDPDRDTLERIKQYCGIFDEQIKGLTHLSNDNPEFKDIMKKFKIHSSKIYLSKEDIEIDKKALEKNVPNVVNTMDKLAPKNNMKYSLDHTIVTYLFGPSNNFLTYLSANLNSEEMHNIVIDEIMNDLTKQVKKLPIVKRE